jgi:hypothetical protein
MYRISCDGQKPINNVDTADQLEPATSPVPTTPTPATKTHVLACCEKATHGVYRNRPNAEKIRKGSEKA